MASKEDLQGWVRDALRAHGGRASSVEVSSHIWGNHEAELRNSSDLFFAWQYDMRRSANRLGRAGVMKAAESSPVGIWEVVGA